jgi:hypothetical protein
MAQVAARGRPAASKSSRSEVRPMASRQVISEWFTCLALSRSTYAAMSTADRVPDSHGLVDFFAFNLGIENRVADQ